MKTKPYILLFFIQRVLFRNSLDFIDPLGLMALAAFMEEKGYEPGVFSGSVTDATTFLEAEQSRRTVSVIGLYCDYENWSAVQSFSRYVKDRWGIPVIIGGPQAVALNEEFLTASGCTAIARGEGEFILWELLENLIHQNRELEHISGISYLDPDKGMVSTPDREPIRNLDLLPFPRSYHSRTRRKNNFSVLTGRGCPFHCAFCNQGGATNIVRFRSVENVIAEIRLGLEENPDTRYVWFADDTFTLKPDRVSRFCDALTEMRADRNFVWFCEGHPATLGKRPHMVRKMVEAGLVRMQIGIETGSPRVFDLYDKQTSLDQIEEVVGICRDAGLPQLCGNIIIGGARESAETLEETWAYVERLLELAPGMLDVSLTLFMPYPGTAMTLRPDLYGMAIADPHAITSVGDHAVVRTEAMGLEEITAARKRFSGRIVATMARLLKTGRVPHESIMNHYRLSGDYGISSIWHSAVYSREPFLHRRYMLLTNSDARCLTEIPEHDRPFWRPLRDFSLWNGLGWKNGIPEISGYVLSPLEYDLLLCCSGKRTIREVTDSLLSHYAGRFDTKAEAGQAVEKLLAEFESRHWLVFAPF